MYVKYCENKPKSEYIVAEYFEYFEVKCHEKLPHNRLSYVPYHVRDRTFD